MKGGTCPKDSHIFETRAGSRIYADPPNFTNVGSRIQPISQAQRRKLATYLSGGFRTSPGGGVLAPPGAKSKLHGTTKRYRAWIALGAQQLAILLDSTKEFIAILGQDGTLHFANATFRNALWDTAGGLTGPEHSCDGPRRGRVRSAQLPEASVWQTESRVTERCRFRCRDGSWRWIEFTCRNRLEDRCLEGIVFHGHGCNRSCSGWNRSAQVNSEIVHALNETANLDQLLTRIHGALKQGSAGRELFCGAA